MTAVYYLAGLLVCMVLVLLSLGQDWESEFGDSARNYGASDEHHTE